MTQAVVAPLVEGLYVGSLQTLAPEGQQTGIYKTPTSHVAVNHLGIIGDVQADKRIHGGVEKALHQYAQSSYATIIAQYPELTDIAVVGSIGENISSPLLDDHNVHIGDIYAIGTTLVQVSQPRSPCWKINHRYDTDMLSKFLAERHISGWYYRVLQDGEISVGDGIILRERFADSMSVADFSAIVTSHRPALATLLSAARCHGLAPEWKTRLENRCGYLAKNQL
jgi:MOSC domain-containing protein YiiM